MRVSLVSMHNTTRSTRQSPWKRWLKGSRKFAQMRGVDVTLCATEAERDAVYRLRHRVYNDELSWSYRHREGRVTSPVDARSFHLQATVNGDLAGCLSFYRLVDGPEDGTDDAARLARDLSPKQRARVAMGSQAAVLPAYRGGGTAVALFWTFYGHLLEMDCNVALMACRAGQTHYYTPFGWRRIGTAKHPVHGEGDLLRHELHAPGPMLRRASPLVLQLAWWRLRGSPITRPVAKG